MKSNKSKAIALISVVVFALAIAALKFENTLGILPILVAIIAFFTCVIHTSMYLSNVKRAEAVSHSDYSQNSNRHTLNQDISERDKSVEASHILRILCPSTNARLCRRKHVKSSTYQHTDRIFGCR